MDYLLLTDVILVTVFISTALLRSAVHVIALSSLSSVIMVMCCHCFHCII